MCLSRFKCSRRNRTAGANDRHRRESGQANEPFQDPDRYDVPRIASHTTSPEEFPWASIENDDRWRRHLISATLPQQGSKRMSIRWSENLSRLTKSRAEHSDIKWAPQSSIRSLVQNHFRTLYVSRYLHSCFSSCSIKQYLSDIDIWKFIRGVLQGLAPESPRYLSLQSEEYALPKSIRCHDRAGGYGHNQIQAQ